MKVAVVGGGSTYTPELVVGPRRASATGSTLAELVLHDIDAARREVVGGLARRMLARERLRRPARRRPTTSTARSTAPTPCCSSSGSAARRRGSRDETRPAALRLHRPGDDRRRRLRQGAAHRAGRARHRRRASRERPRPARGSSTSPTRSGSSRGRCSTPATARSACATSRSASSGCSRGCSASRPSGSPSTRSASTTSPGCARCGSTARDVLAELLDEHGDAIAGRRRAAARRCSTSSARVPSYYLRYFYAHDEVLAEQRVGDAAGGDGRRDRARAARALPRPRARRRSRRCSSSAAARSTARRRRRCSPSLVQRRPATCRSSTCATTARCPGWRTTTSSRCPRGSARPVPVALPQAPLAPELLGLVQHVAAYERLAAARGGRPGPADVRRALLAHPLIGQIGPRRRA